MMKNESSKSYLMLIASMVIFGTIGIFRRLMPDLSSGLLAFFRGIIGVLFLTAFVKIRGRKIFHGIGRKNTLLLVLSGAMIGINWILLFEAYRYTTVATATLCYYMQPIIVILLSPLFFKERLSLRKLLCVLCAFLGMSFLSGVWEGGIGANLQGILLGLGAAFFYSAVVILNKMITAEDAYERTILQLLSASIVILPYLLLNGDFSGLSFTLKSLVLLLVVGIIHTGIAYALYFGAMKGLKAQSIAILGYIDPVCAVLLSVLLLHESLSLYGILGAVLILGSALISELHWDRQPKKHFD